VGAALWVDPEGSRFVGSAHKHNLMKEFIKRTKTAAAAAQHQHQAAGRATGR
jgi:hypothetical protein